MGRTVRQVLHGAEQYRQRLERAGAALGMAPHASRSDELRDLCRHRAARLVFGSANRFFRLEFSKAEACGAVHLGGDVRKLLRSRAAKATRIGRHASPGGVRHYDDRACRRLWGVTCYTTANTG